MRRHWFGWLGGMCNRQIRGDIIILDGAIRTRDRSTWIM